MTPYYIIDILCGCLKLDWQKLISQNDQTRDYYDARFIAMYLIRERIMVKKTHKRYGTSSVQIPYKEVSYLFNRCNHATALHAELECKKLLKIDPNFKKKYDMVVNLLDRNLNAA